MARRAGLLGLALLHASTASTCVAAESPSRRSPRAAPPVVVGCIGDSITCGACGTPQGYPEMLQAMLGPSFEVHNLCASGHTMLKCGTANVSADPRSCPRDASYWTTGPWQQAQDLDADIYTILLGTNDAKTYQWFPCEGGARGTEGCSWLGADNYTADFLEMIATLKAQRAAPKVYVMRPTPIYVPFFSNMNATVTNVVLGDLLPRVVAASAAERGIVDMFGAMGGYNMSLQNLTCDGVHPVQAGYQLMANTLYTALTNATPPPPPPPPPPGSCAGNLSVGVDVDGPQLCPSQPGTVASVDDCCAASVAQKGACPAFVYITSSKECYLLERYSGTHPSDPDHTTGVTGPLPPPPPPPPPFYEVETTRLNNGDAATAVLYDSRHNASSTEFGYNFGNSFVRLLAEGLDALAIRACVRADSSCATLANPDVITLVTRADEPVDLARLQQQWAPNTKGRIILTPNGTDEQCGVQDPRLAVDAATGIYYLAFTVYGDASGGGACRDVSTKVAVTRTPLVADSWQRLTNRTGDAGFDEKSTALLIRAAPPHFAYTGTGTIRIWRSDDLYDWNNTGATIAGRGGDFDDGYVEPGGAPQRLSSGDYFFPYVSILSHGAGWGAGWAILNGSDPTQVLQRASAPLVQPTMPWELGADGGGPEWEWELTPRCIGTVGGLQPLGNDTFILWTSAGDAVVEPFLVKVTALPQ